MTSSNGSKTKYDVIVIGGGHNGLTNAAYLARAGKRVLVLERRHVLGGAAVTEEVFPGSNFLSGPMWSRFFARRSFATSTFRATALKIFHSNGRSRLIPA